MTDRATSQPQKDAVGALAEAIEHGLGLEGPLNAADILAALPEGWYFDYTHPDQIAEPPDPAIWQGLPATRAQPDEPRAVVVRWARLIVSYADLTHDVVQQGRDWREIAAEWQGVVAEARVLLASAEGEKP